MDRFNVAEPLSEKERASALDVCVRSQSVSATKIKPLDQLAAACIYAGCILAGTPRNRSEVSNITCVPTRKITKIYNDLKRGLPENGEFKRPADFFDEYAGRLRLTAKERTAVSGLIRRVESTNLAYLGLAPGATCAAAINLGSSKTMKEIEKATEVSEQTLRRHTNIMRRTLMLENVGTV